MPTHTKHEGVHPWNLNMPQSLWEAILVASEGQPKQFVLQATRDALERKAQGGTAPTNATPVPKQSGRKAAKER